MQSPNLDAQPPQSDFGLRMLRLDGMIAVVIGSGAGEMSVGSPSVSFSKTERARAVFCQRANRSEVILGSSKKGICIARIARQPLRDTKKKNLMSI